MRAMRARTRVSVAALALVGAALVLSSVLSLVLTTGAARAARPTEVKLTASDPAVADFFGIPVDVSGNTVVAAAAGDDDDGSRSGSVYVFNRGAGGWTEQAKLTASDAATEDQLGFSAAVDSQIIVAGAAGEDDLALALVPPTSSSGLAPPGPRPPSSRRTTPP